MLCLEKICQKVLGIGEKVSMPEIVSFINENDKKDLRVLPLVNFQDEKVYKMTDDKVTNGVRHTILLYEKLNGIFGKYYLLYCERNDGDYIRVYSNRKINKVIQHFVFLEEEIEDNLFRLPGRVTFTPVSNEYIEKLNLVYREVVFG